MVDGDAAIGLQRDGDAATAPVNVDGGREDDEVGEEYEDIHEEREMIAQEVRRRAGLVLNIL